MLTYARKLAEMMSPSGHPLCVKPDSDCADMLSGCASVFFPEGCDSSDPQGYQELLGGVGESFLTFSLTPFRPAFEFVASDPTGSSSFLS